jgi:hypothetical protein
MSMRIVDNQDGGHCMNSVWKNDLLRLRNP